MTQKNLKNYIHESERIEQKIEKEKNPNSMLIVLRLIEKREIYTLIRELENSLMKLKNEKNVLLSTKTSQLIEEKNILESSLLSHNYKNTAVVGAIITSDNPIKPKKSLIIVVTFITGIILSIFLVFLLEFMKNTKEESLDKTE
nr:hypothetical protein [Sulfurospirillum sp.]